MSLKIQLNHLSKAELIKVCEKCKCAKTGTKSVLIDNILNSNTKDLLNKLTVSQLKDILTKEKLQTSGGKSELIQRLQSGEKSQVLTENNGTELLSKEEANKILALLIQGEDTYLQQGKELLASLVDKKNMYRSVAQIFELGIPKSYTAIYENIRAKGVAQNQAFNLTTWIIALAEDIDAEWIQNRIRKYQISLEGYEFEWVSESLSKETYEYWSENDIEQYVFYGEEYDGDIPEEHDFNDRSEWWNVGGGCNESGIEWDLISEINIEELIGDREYDTIDYDTSDDPNWIECEVEKVPYLQPGKPEVYGVDVVESSKGTVAIGNFEITEDFDIRKLTFTADCDEAMGMFLPLHGISYVLKNRVIEIECERWDSTPKVAQAILFKGSKQTRWQKVSQKS